VLALAQDLIPLGGDFGVSGVIATDQAEPLVLTTPEDGFAVLWRSSGEIRHRRYDALAAPSGAARALAGVGGPFSAAGADQAGFIVAGTTSLPDGPAIVAQRYTWAGEPAWVSPVAVSDESDPTASFPSVAVAAGGDVLVAWQGGPTAPPFPLGREVFARAFAADGAPRAAAVRLNALEHDYQGLPAVAAGADGSLLVTWSAAPKGETLSRLYGCIAGADGRVGSAFEIPTATPPFSWPSAARLGAGYLVAWTGGPERRGIYARRLDADGTLLGDEMALAGGDRDPATSPHGLTPRGDGLLLAWGAWTADYGEALLRARRFDAEAQPIGDVLPLNGARLTGGTFIAVAADATGGFVATWVDDRLEQPDPIIARRFVTCGDGMLRGEACDDGNRLDGDGCDANCTPTACGNGIRTAGEDCDDGNLTEGDGCSALCRIQSTFTPTVTATPTVTPTPRSVFDVSGCVPHATSGCGFEFGSVTLDPPHRTAAVSGGAFRFTDVAPGTYTLSYSPPCNPFGCRPPISVTVVDDDVFAQFPLVPRCAGDCGPDGTVTVDEIVLCIAGALDGALRCSACDADCDGRTTVDDLVRAVANALSGCTG